MTNVLSPTNFSTESLESVNAIVRNIPGKLNIFLFHAFDLPDTLIDAMHKVGRRGYTDLITEALRLKCKQLKTLNPDISNICFKVMYGTTVVAFQNFAEANKIDIIFIPANHKFFPVVRESVNYERMFLKSGLRIVNGENRTNIADADAYANGLTQSMPLYKTINP